MHTAFSLVGGASLGAGLMFFLDPLRGRRRRALARDKGLRWSRKTREFTGSASRDVQTRAKGMSAAVRSWVQPAPPVPDHVLAERIRSKLGKLSRHPSAIDVHVTEGGVVTLSGPVLDDEVESMCGVIARIPGVARIVDRMDRHQSPEGVPALQGPVGPRPGPRFTSMQSPWSPVTRTAAAVMGTAALVYGLNRRTVGAATLAATGLGLILRSATNQEFSRFFDFKTLFGREQAQQAA